MPAFHKYRDKAIKAVDKVMAETLRLFPMKSGVADGTRDQHEFQAVLRSGGEGIDSVGPGGDWSSRIASGEAMIYIDRTVYAGPAIRVGDRFRSLDRPGQPFFEVLNVNDRQHGRLVLHMGEV